MTVSKEKAAEIAAEIKDVLRRHGMEPKISWKYGPWLEVKLTASVVAEGDNGVNLASPEAQYFTKYGHTSYNRDASGKIVTEKLDAPLGTVFVSRGTRYAFAGIASKRRKYPIYALNVEEGTPTFFTEQIIKVINAAAKAAV